MGYILRNEAEVNYTPTRFGLAPSTVIHRQFLNQDLLVENRFSIPAIPAGKRFHEDAQSDEDAQSG